MRIVSIALAVLMVVITCAQGQDDSDYRLIEAEEMARLYEENADFKLLDVQTMNEHVEYGFPPRSICIPLRFQDSVTKEWTDNPDFLTTCKKRFNKDDRIILLCTSGVRSVEAAELLAEAGFSNLLVFVHGIHGKETASGEFLPGWVDHDLPFVWGTLN